MRLEQAVKNDLTTSLDNHFPKGQCEERGAGLMLMAEAYQMMRKLIRAFGGCDKCYGKGYGTQTLSRTAYADFHGDVETTTKEPTVAFCTCPRGEQLEALWKTNGSIGD